MRQSVRQVRSARKRLGYSCIPWQSLRFEDRRRPPLFLVARWFFALCLAHTVSARQRRECDVRIKCWYMDPNSPRMIHNKTTGQGGPGTPGFNAPGTYDPNKASCWDGKCPEFDCLYGRDSVESCPDLCGTHEILCECVAQDYARKKNKEKKDVIIGVGWAFFVFMIFVPLVGWRIAQCMRQNRERNAQQQQAQLQMVQQMGAMAAPQSLSVTVPAGMGPGQALQVANPAAGGALIQLTVPIGVTAV